MGESDLQNNLKTTEGDQTANAAKIAELNAKLKKAESDLQNHLKTTEGDQTANAAKIAELNAKLKKTETQRQRILKLEEGQAEMERLREQVKQYKQEVADVEVKETLLREKE